jgi:hypothetical protein
MESYKHLFAKRVLAEWLRVDNGSPLVSASPNRSNAAKGVYTEYPVCLDPDNKLVGVSPLWDESDRFYNFNQCVPEYQDCVDIGLLPIVVFDVVVLHKGYIGHAFEVVHHSPLSKYKRQYLNRIFASGELGTLHVLEADWVLSQCQRPNTLKHIERYSVQF